MTTLPIPESKKTTPKHSKMEPRIGPKSDPKPHRQRMQFWRHLTQKTAETLIFMLVGKCSVLGQSLMVSWGLFWYFLRRWENSGVVRSRLPLGWHLDRIPAFWPIFKDSIVKFLEARLGDNEDIPLGRSALKNRRGNFLYCGVKLPWYHVATAPLYHIAMVPYYHQGNMLQFCFVNVSW